jgi:tetratricopeptide (TPR) repeat protein
MDLLRCRRSVAKFHVLIFMALSMASIPVFPQIPSPQSQSSVSSRPTRHDSVEVVGHLSPAEVEEGKLNDMYESVAELQRKGTCTSEIIQRYESEVIPPAEKSTLNVPRNKFLFLANRDIGNCYLAQQKFPEAEASFQKILQYASVWPGTNDSAYPINFRQIATAQMGQQHWKAAEQSLVKSIALFEPQISAGEKSDVESHFQFSLNYRGSQSRSYALLAVVYFREGLIQDALDTVEKAYDEVTKYNLAPQYRNEVERIGKSIAVASGNAAAQKLWSERSPAN